MYKITSNTKIFILLSVYEFAKNFQSDG